MSDEYVVYAAVGHKELAKTVNRAMAENPKLKMLGGLTQVGNRVCQAGMITEAKRRSTGPTLKAFAQ